MFVPNVKKGQKNEKLGSILTHRLEIVLRSRSHNSTPAHKVGIPVVSLLLLLASGCGNGVNSNRSNHTSGNETEVSSGKNYSDATAAHQEPLSADEVVLRFEEYENLPDQEINPTDMEEWQKSLVYIEQIDDQVSGDLDTQDAFSLNDTAVNEREIIDLRSNDTAFAIRDRKVLAQLLQLSALWKTFRSAFLKKKWTCRNDTTGRLMLTTRSLRPWTVPRRRLSSVSPIGRIDLNGPLARLLVEALQS